MRDGGVEYRMCVDEPLRASVVEVRQRALLERLRRVLVTGNWTLWVAGNRLVDPFGRIEPAVTQLDESSGFQGFRFEHLVKCLNIEPYSVQWRVFPSLHPSFRNGFH